MLFVFLACTTAAVTTDPEVEQLQEQVNALQEQVNALQDQLGVSSGDTEQPDTTTADRLTALEAQAEAEAEQLEALGDAVSLLQGTQPRIWTSVTLAPEAGQTEDWETVITLDLDIEEEGTVWVQQRSWGEALTGYPGVTFHVNDLVSPDISYDYTLDGLVFWETMSTFNAPLDVIDVQARNLAIDKLDLLVIFTPGV